MQRIKYAKHVFLDLDGPLLDGKDRHYQCYKVIMDRLGFIPVDVDEYWKGKRARTDLVDLLRMSGAEAIYDRFLAAWLAIIESPAALVLDKLQDGALDCLRKWKEKNITIALVTMRKNRPGLDAQLESTGLRELLDAVLVCDHALGGLGKADAVRELYGNTFTYANCFWIGDTEADWEAANSIGCRAFLVSNGLRNSFRLGSLGCVDVFPSITSLENALDEFG